MRFKKYWVLLLSALTSISFFGSCNMEPAEVDSVPKISFESIKFKEGGNDGGRDSLYVTINFIDGDGDLGLPTNFNDPPFHPFEIQRDQNGEAIKYGSRSGLPSYSCNYWHVRLDNESNPIDTVLIERNLYHYNYIVHFFVRKNGEYEEYDWRQRSLYDCGETFNARFPILNDSGTSRALEGELKYGMGTRGFSNIFRNDTLKLSVQIIDRSLNKSNVLETPEFTLNGIKTSN